MAERKIIHEATAMLKIKHGKTPSTVVFIPTKRRLTIGEIKMCQLVFKDSINYKNVFVHRNGFLGYVDFSGFAMTPNGEIYLPSNEYDNVPDFSMAAVPSRNWFIHEMTHVWQYQLGLKNWWHGIVHGGFVAQRFKR